MDNDEIEVDDVIERNNCAGKKYICVTAKADKHIIQSQFRMSPAYMNPSDKLALASVAPDDRVRVVLDHHQLDPLVIGDYADNLSSVWERDSVCRCQTPLVSDGFDVYCPNPTCALTVASRIERLVNTSFFRSETIRSDMQEGYFDYQGVAIFDDATYCRPFIGLDQGEFWGEPGAQLENILLTQKYGDISLSTFLIKPLLDELFQELRADHVRIYNNILRFYGEMDEFVNRRNVSSERQFQLINQFIWALGIEALSPDYILTMTNYERICEITVDPMLTYAYLLTHPKELVAELGFHPLEARAIVLEVARRRYELFDIFAHYTQNREDVTRCFADLM